MVRGKDTIGLWCFFGWRKDINGSISEGSLGLSED